MKRPQSLYRYRSIAGERLDWEIEGVRTPSVFCSTYKQLNDPMEGYYEAERLLGADHLFREILNTKLGIGIASFSERNDSDTMWAYYAENYSGICIEYDYSQLSERFGDEANGLLQHVVYSDRQLTLRHNELHDGLAAVHRILLRKRTSWRQELEWRLLAHQVGVVRLLPETIRSIYFGCRIEPRSRRTFVSALSTRDEIDLYDMDARGFKLNWRPVRDQRR